MAKISYVMERIGIGGNIVLCFLRSRVSSPNIRDLMKLIHLVKYIKCNPEDLSIKIGVSGDCSKGYPLTMYADASHQTTNNKRAVGGVVMTAGIGPQGNEAS